MASVKVVEHENGDVSLGFESEGVFIPALMVHAHRIAHYKDRAADLAERLEANPDDAEALAAVAAVPVSAKFEAKSRKGSDS